MGDSLKEKEFSDDIETKGLLSGGLNVGKKLWNSGRVTARQGKTALAKRPGALAKKFGNPQQKAAAASSVRPGKKENIKFRQFGMTDEGVTVAKHTGRQFPTPMEKIARKKRRAPSRKLLRGGLGAAGIGGVAYGAGEIQGEHKTRQKLKRRPYWMDEG